MEYGVCYHRGIREKNCFRKIDPVELRIYFFSIIEAPKILICHFIVTSTKSRGWSKTVHVTTRVTTIMMYLWDPTTMTAKLVPDSRP